MTLSPKQKVRKAIEAIFDQHPLFASIVARWRIVPTDKIPTFATNGPDLFYNPTFTAQWSIAETTWILLHEAGHIFLGHHLRADEMPERTRANEAMDLALNHIIQQQLPPSSDKLRAMILLPGVGRYAPLAGGRSAEFYYDAMTPKPEPKSEQSDDDQTGDDRAEGDQSGADGQPGGENEADGQPGDGDGQPGDDGKPGEAGDADGQAGQDSGQDTDAQDEPGEGSGSNGPSKAGKPGKTEPEAKSTGSSEPSNDDAPGTLGDVLPHPDMNGTETDRVIVEQEWQEIVSEAVNTARQCGKLPGWLYQTAKQNTFGKSNVNHRLLLKRFMTEYANEGFTYERPNRRAGWRRDVIIPARKSRDSGKGCVIVDTSGSMSEEQCNVALREIENVLKAFPQAVVVVKQCDVRDIKEAEKTFTRFDFPLRAPGQWFGRGGTDMDPALADVRKRSSQFKWLIVISDMIWNCSEAKPVGVPTLWFKVGGYFLSGKPTFGQVVECPVMQEKNA